MSAISIKLNNGREIPALGLGTWKPKPGDLIQAVKDAIDIGYRHFDCALIYDNEVEVGEGIKQKIADGTVKREDLFVTSKLWNTFHRPDLVEKGIKISLKNLGLDYLDLYLVHWPFAMKEGDTLVPGKGAFSDVDYVDTWIAMEELVKKNLTKSIGISNFNKRQIDRVLQVATIPPVVNQVEVHPYLNQTKLINYCKTKNIVIVGYSPLGSPARPWAQPGEPSLLEDPKIIAIAAKYKKTAAQIILKYTVQRGCSVIPKSASKVRLQENYDIWNFNLSAEDVATIDTFDCNGRICPHPDAFGHKDYPFTDHDEF